MNKNIIYSLTDNFETHSHKTSDGVEFWDKTEKTEIEKAERIRKEYFNN